MEGSKARMEQTISTPPQEGLIGDKEERICQKERRQFADEITDIAGPQER